MSDNSPNITDAYECKNCGIWIPIDEYNENDGLCDECRDRMNQGGERHA